MKMSGEERRFGRHFRQRLLLLQSIRNKVKIKLCQYSEQFKLFKIDGIVKIGSFQCFLLLLFEGFCWLVGPSFEAESPTFPIF